METYRNSEFTVEEGEKVWKRDEKDVGGMRYLVFSHD